jgi:hypothetical protein
MASGACRTKYLFPNVPGMGHSSGAYLLGVRFPDLLQKLGLNLKLLWRDPHYSLTTANDAWLLASPLSSGCSCNGAAVSGALL